MKLRMFAVAAIAGMLVVGCNQESSVNSPVAEPGSSIKSSLGKISASGVLKIDETIYDEAAGDRYSVAGMVHYESSYDYGDYSFGCNAELIVSDNISGVPAVVQEKRVTSGSMKGKILNLSQNYALDGSMSGKSLRVNFRLSFESDEAVVEVTSVEIV